MLSKEKLQDLNDQLPVNPTMLILEQLDKIGISVTGQTVRNNLSGRYFNSKIIGAAIKVRDQHQKQIKSLSDQI